MQQTRTIPTAAPQAEKRLRKPVQFFVAAFIAQGIAQHFGLVSQPLQYFLMEHEQLSAAKVAAYMSLLMVPWIIKPVYALLSDCVPVMGYRRRSYLLLVSAIAGLALLTVPVVGGADAVVATICVSGVAMAFGNVVLNGLTIETCQLDSKLRNLWSTQGLSYYSANILCLALGGYLCERFGSLQALNMAGGIAGAAPLLLLPVVAYMVQEKRSSASSFDWKGALLDLKSCLSNKVYLSVMAYMCLYNFSPAFNVPLYFYESNVLRFSQATIGQLNASNAFGMLCGALVFKLVLEKRWSVKRQLVVTAIYTLAATLAYLFLTPDPIVASIIHFLNGTASMSALLALYGAATTVCPRRIEASAFAILIAAYNLAGQLAMIGGGYLYSNIVHQQIGPLVWISAATTLICIPIALLADWRESPA